MTETRQELSLDDDWMMCPRCGESWDSLMDRPALKVRGHNPTSGALFSCRACDDRITEAEIVTGKKLSELVEKGFDQFEPGDLDYKEVNGYAQNA